MFEGRKDDGQETGENGGRQPENGVGVQEEVKQRCIGTGVNPNHCEILKVGPDPKNP